MAAHASTTAPETCPAIRPVIVALPRRLRAAPEAVPLNAERDAVRAATSVGIAARLNIVAAAQTTVASRARVSRVGSPTVFAVCRTVDSQREHQEAINAPAAADTDTMTAHSWSHGAASCPFVAPNARRTEISWRSATARARKSHAMFTHARAHTARVASHRR